jgi:hypothetical protein
MCPCIRALYYSKISMNKASSLLVPFRRQNEVISLWQRYLLSALSPWYLFLFGWETCCMKLTDQWNIKSFSGFQPNENISFRQRKGTKRLATGEFLGLKCRYCLLCICTTDSATWYSTHTCSTLRGSTLKKMFPYKNFYFKWGQYTCGAPERLTAFGARTFLVLSQQ